MPQIIAVSNDIRKQNRAQQTHRSNDTKEIRPNAPELALEQQVCSC